jgi:hypothetical protein
MTAREKALARFAVRQSCGAVALFRGACFCGPCSEPLTGGRSGLPNWQRPAPAKYEHVIMNRTALSCRECREPMCFEFWRVCRLCGAKLVRVPRQFHPSHVRVYVAGPSAAMTAFAVDGFWLVIVLTGFAALREASIP